MAPEMARLFFVAWLCLLAGGGLGAYATRVVYGEEGVEVDPSRDRERPCPACGECPACPAPPDCGALGVVPEAAGTAGPPPPRDDPPGSARPGLPAAAIPLARRAVEEAILPCSEVARENAWSAIALLDLTITASAGRGAIREALFQGGSGDASRLEACLTEHAARATFEWPGPEGEARFKLPVKVGR